MFKNISKQNFIPFFYILIIYLMSIIFKSENHTVISQHLFLTIIIPNVLFCFLFFLIPPKYAEFSFFFMFISEGIKFISFSLFFVLGLHYIHDDYLNHYTLFAIVGLFLTILSTVFFFKNAYND